MLRDRDEKAEAELKAAAEARKEKLRAETAMSSVPQEIFDSTDPMLEARLTELTEDALRLLRGRGHMPSQEAIANLPLEPVAAEEIAGFLHTLAARPDGGRPPLLEGIENEFFGVLIDTYLTARAAMQRRALNLLKDGLDLSPEAGLDRLTSDLVTTLASLGKKGSDERLESLCKQIATAVVVASPELGDEP